MSEAFAIFSAAAPVQKMVFVLLAAATLTSCAAALIRPLVRSERFDRAIACLVLACPMLGVVRAALNLLHMMQTTVRLPIAVTGQMLAPGIAEMVAFVALGATAGLAAFLAGTGFPRPAARRPAT